MDTSIMCEFSQSPLSFLSVFNGVSHSISIGLISTEDGIQIDRHGHWHLGGKIPHPCQSFPQDGLLQVQARSSIYDDTGLLAIPGTMSPDTTLSGIPQADIVVVSKRFFEGARGKGISPLDLDRLFLIESLYSDSSPRAKKWGQPILRKQYGPCLPNTILSNFFDNSSLQIFQPLLMKTAPSWHRISLILWLLAFPWQPSVWP